MNDIKISVIIPIYNMEWALSQCIDCVLKQTLDDIELICVDNDSTDGSMSVLNNYETKYSNIKVFREMRKGASYARNLGISKSQGEFLFFLDADDQIYDERTLEKLYRVAKQNNLDIAGGLMYYVNADGVADDKKNNEQLIKRIIKTDSQIVDYSEYQWDYGYYCYIYKRSFLISNDITFPNYLRHQDPPFFVKAMSIAGKFACINEYVYAYKYNYKPIRLNEKSSMDVVCATIDVLTCAYENGYFRLANVCIEHFNEAYSNQLLLNLSVPLLTKILELQKKTEQYDMPELKVLNDIFSLKSQNDDKNAKLDELLERVKHQGLLMEEQHKTLAWQSGVIDQRNKTISKQNEIIKYKLWPYPIELFEKGDQIIIYGAGDVGKDLYFQAISLGYNDVVLTDSKYLEKGLKSPKSVLVKKNCKVLIATVTEKINDSITTSLLGMNIPGENIISYIDWLESKKL